MKGKVKVRVSVKGNEGLRCFGAEELVEFGEAGGGADFVEAFGEFVASEGAAAGQIGLDGGEIDNGVAWARGEGVGAEEAEAVVDVVHLRRALGLGVEVECGRLRTRRCWCRRRRGFKHGHERRLTGGEEGAADGLIIHGQVTVPVEHVESVAEFRQGADEGAAGAEEFRAVERVVDGNAPRGAVAVSVDDFFTEVADAKDDAREAVFFSKRSWCEKNGSPATSTRSLGIFSVIGRNRVARPPARIATGSVAGSVFRGGVDKGLHGQGKAVEQVVKQDPDGDAEQKTVASRSGAGTAEANCVVALAEGVHGLSRSWISRATRSASLRPPSAGEVDAVDVVGGGEIESHDGARDAVFAPALGDGVVDEVVALEFVAGEALEVVGGGFVEQDQRARAAARAGRRWRCARRVAHAPRVRGSRCWPDRGRPTVDALKVLDFYAVAIPPKLRARLEAGELETPKPGNPRLARSEFRLIASPRQMLEAAASAVRQLGITPLILGDALEGEAREVGKVLAGMALACGRHGFPAATPCVLLSGGETTVSLKGRGRGGRNTEFLLGLALALDGAPGIHALAADTDGIDGSEDNAGAFVDPSSLRRAGQQRLDIRAHLATNDAWGYFSALDDLLLTGPTLTNVNDFRALLVGFE